MSFLTKTQLAVIGGIFGVLVIVAGTATFIVLRNNGDAGPAVPVVQVAEGTLQGIWMDVPETSDRFAAFMGVPYAQPPTGPLRFKAPRFSIKWSGVRDATEDSADCMQDGPPAPYGSEDCLYLNVYTPQLPGQMTRQLPVYFFIYGGSFIFGTGNHSLYGPEFLMRQNVVVVTIKYRLNVFGFLNLDNDVVPGNAGIKDQVAALKWVHENIAQFGGDPRQITVGGQSAGAVSAHWLSLLPESRDLIKSVILESGSALHSFGYNEDNFDVALDLGTRLAHGPVRTEDVAKMVMNLTADTIMSASIAMATERMATLATQLPYAPSPERRRDLIGGETPLITQSPETYIIDPSVVKKPMLVGMNSREWLAGYYSYGYANDPNMMPARIANLTKLSPKNIIPFQDTISFLNLTDAASFKWQDAFDAIKPFYFQRSDAVCNLTCTFKRYLDDIVIGVDTNRLAELRARSKLSTTYVYRFAVRDAYSLSPFVDPEQLPDGACHSDELGYIWKIGALDQKLEGTGLASVTLKRMTSVWGSFMATGVPSPNESYDGVWLPTEQRKAKIIYMDIGTELKVKEGHIAGVNMPFWFNLYQKYRDNLST